MQAVQPAPSRLRPLNLGDLLDMAFRLYRQNFITFIGVVALLQVPMLILQILLTVTVGGNLGLDMIALANELLIFDPQTDSFAALPLGGLTAYMGGILLLSLLQILIAQQLINGALANAVSQSYLDRPVSILNAYGFGLERIVNLLVAGLLMGIIVLLLYTVPMGIALLLMFTAVSGDAMFAFLAVMAVIASAIIALLLVFAALLVFLFVTQSIVIEGKGPLGALRRSWHMVVGSFWRVLGIVMLVFILIYVLQAIPSAFASFFINIIYPDQINDFAIRQTLLTIVSYLAQILFLPLQLIAYTLLYYDIRIRKEGFDLQLLTQTYDTSHNQFS